MPCFLEAKPKRYIRLHVATRPARGDGYAHSYTLLYADVHGGELPYAVLEERHSAGHPYLARFESQARPTEWDFPAPVAGTVPARRIFRQEYRNPDPRSSQDLVSRKFCSHHGISHEESKTYPARLEDGLLVIDVVGE